jgi:hypothetical protein
MMNQDDEFSLNNPQASLLGNEEPEFNADQYRQDTGGLITSDNGIADRLLSKNDKLYRSLKGDWKREGWNKSQNIKVTTGRENGKFYITREQFNCEELAREAQEYRRRAEAGVPDPLAPLDDSGGLAWRWMILPKVVAVKISDEYFGGMPWAVIKRDKSLKAQFYKVVEKEYNQYVCYPNGKLPIPIDVSYPTKVGQQRFFKGM